MYRPELDEELDAREEGRSKSSRSMSMLDMGDMGKALVVVTEENNEE